MRISSNKYIQCRQQRNLISLAFLFFLISLAVFFGSFRDRVKKSEPKRDRPEIDIKRILSKNVDKAELEDFFRYKEQQFEERRSRIRGVCAEMSPAERRRAQVVGTPYFYYVRGGPLKMSLCPIPKVASTKWRTHFRSLWHFHTPDDVKIEAEIAEVKMQRAGFEYHLVHNKIFGPPGNEWKQREALLASEANSITFVRNPFDRLVSQSLILIMQGKIDRLSPSHESRKLSSSTVL